MFRVPLSAGSCNGTLGMSMKSSWFTPLAPTPALPSHIYSIEDVGTLSFASSGVTLLTAQLPVGCIQAVLVLPELGERPRALCPHRLKRGKCLR